MSLRFITRDSGIREMKEAMSREILTGLREAHIGLASGTYDIVGLPPVHVVMDQAPAPAGRPRSPDWNRIRAIAEPRQNW